MAFPVSTRAATLCFGLLLCSIACPCLGHQHYRSRLPNSLTVRCPPDNPGCEDGDLCKAIGHLTCSGGGERNPFGKDFEAAGHRWTFELCLKDSDGDGFSNGYELGDPCCIWHEGGNLPQWMLDWPTSHPGFAQSTQIENEIDVASFCKDKNPLETRSFYNAGETRMDIEYHLKNHTLQEVDTAYLQFRFNFPDNDTYDLVGMEALIDNEEFVHHYVVTSCTEKSEEEGFVIGEDMIQDCAEIFLVWAPGADNTTFPKNTGFRVGKGTSRVGFNLEIHYDNPELKSGETDASGLRFHYTTTLREHEVGLLWTGTIFSIGAIPPKQKFYSSTIFQVEVDEDTAPGGISIFAFTPHMHYLGRRIWTEKLRRTEGGASDLLTDLSTLEKVGDVARDDSWDIKVQFQGRIPETKIRDGEYLSTTCLYDSADRTEFTIGGLASQDEMCVNLLYYYPAEAVNSQIYHSGPRFAGAMTDDAFRSIDSVTQILALHERGSALPEWRAAYLRGELSCDETMPGHDLQPNDFSSKTAVERKAVFNEGYKAACDQDEELSLLILNDTIRVDCSPECVAFLYNTMGCALVRDAVRDGKVMPLAPSPQEAIFDDQCAEAFLTYYDENKVEGGATLFDLTSEESSAVPLLWASVYVALLACISVFASLI